MVTWDRVLKGIRQPQLVFRELRRVFGALQNRRAGHSVMEEEWDNLIILDACRYDMFESVADFEGRLERRRSSGSATPEFLENNFGTGTFHDTVYVSANPHVDGIDDGRFHATVDVWRRHWSDDPGTVLPSTMAEQSLEAHGRYPNKRLICHFIQPHHPFLGPTAESDLPTVDGNEHARSEAEGDDAPASERDHVWRRVAAGEVDIETVERAYRETLEQTLPHVEWLLSRLPGRTVVTSDHGNLLDEPAYGIASFGTRRHDHPIYATADPLVNVPWLVVEGETRKTVTPEPPVSRSETDRIDTNPSDEVIEDRLEALGYK